MLQTASNTAKHRIRKSNITAIASEYVTLVDNYSHLSYD